MPRRIVFLDHAPIIGGAQLALVEHIRHLDRRRFEVHVLCGDMPEMAERFAQAGATVHSIHWPRLKHLSPWRAMRLVRTGSHLRALLRSLDPAVIVANTSRAGYTASISGVHRIAPLIWWVRDFDFGRRLFRLLEWTTTRRIAVSNAIRAFYGDVSDPAFDVIYVASGIHSRFSAISDEAVTRERQRWGFGPADLVVGYMGRLVEGKGPADLVAAVEQLAAEFPHLRLLIVGSGRGQEGDVEGALHQLVNDRGLTNVVRFAGFQSDEALYYRLFDVFVLSSRYREAMPTSVIQAMMAGKPVVATATGGTPEVVTDDATGLVVPPADPHRMAAALRRILADTSLAERLSRAGYAHAMAVHREEHATRRLETLYDEISRSR